MKTVDKIKEENLCINCGVCKSICPKNAITYKKRDSGMYETVINEQLCIKCGLCYKVCPSNIHSNFDVLNKMDIINKLFIGDYISSFVCATKNQKILNESTSGGFITTTINFLLEKNIYEGAFVLKGYNYNNQVITQFIKKNIDLVQTAKSRYLPISQYETAKYMIENPSKKIIIVGTPCNILSLNNLIKQKKLNRNNYLFIGLFCDKTMTYNVIDYFKNHPLINNKIIKDFYFRTKDNNSWPGDIGITFNDNSKIILPRKERMCVKEYFSTERCLYCTDKLNCLADISTGDNYTNTNISKNGSNSVLIRTENGQKIWDMVKHLFIFRNSHINELITSQKLNERYKNIIYLKIKNSENITYKNIENISVTSKQKKSYNNLLKKIKLGSTKKYKKIYIYTHSKLYKLIIKLKSLL